MASKGNVANLGVYKNPPQSGQIGAVWTILRFETSIFCTQHVWKKVVLEKAFTLIWNFNS